MIYVKILSTLFNNSNFNETIRHFLLHKIIEMITFNVCPFKVLYPVEPVMIKYDPGPLLSENPFY